MLSILRGRTRPSRTSWIIWAVLCAVVAATYRASGATTTFWITVSYTLITSVVALLSFRYGENVSSNLDWICLGGALSSLIVWAVMGSAPSALYLAIVVDALAVFPTLHKAYFRPESEDRNAWSIAFAATAMNLLALDTWSPQISAYPIYCFLSVGLIAAVLFLRKGANAATPAIP